MHAREAAALGLALATVTAGCLGTVPGLLLASQGTGDPGPRPTWSTGDWWSFRVEVPSGGSAASTFVVHDAGPEGYKMGSNGTHGFFGIPFHGRLEPDLDPHVAGEVWDMFRFPLRDGQTWTQQFLGHPVTTEVASAELEAPDGETVDGYELTVQAYGSRIASYTYAPDLGWLTSFTLRDPETGDPLAWANLTDRGADYGNRYLIQERVQEVERSYPGDAPGEAAVPVEAKGTELVASLAASSGPGVAEASLEDPHGNEVARVEASGQDVDEAQVTTAVQAGEWTLDHRGLGSGHVGVQIHVVREAGAGDGAVPEGRGTAGGGPTLPSLPALLGTAADPGTAPPGDEASVPTEGLG